MPPSVAFICRIAVKIDGSRPWSSSSCAQRSWESVTAAPQSGIAPHRFTADTKSRNEVGAGSRVSTESNGSASNVASDPAGERNTYQRAPRRSWSRLGSAGWTRSAHS